LKGQSILKVQILKNSYHQKIQILKNTKNKPKRKKRNNGKKEMPNGSAH
jgi:hypothetical protein